MLAQPGRQPSDGCSSIPKRNAQLRRRRAMADETAAPAIEIPPDLKARAQAAGWPDDLGLMLLQRGAAPADLTRYMMMGVTADQVREFIAAQAAGGGGLPAPQLDLAWMRVPTEGGTRAQPAKKGLPPQAINLR